MNITVVCDILGTETNGTTVATTNFIKYLQIQKHNVKILCADADKKGLPNYYVVPNLSLGPLDKIVEKNNVTLAKPRNDIIEEALEGADHVHIMLPFILGRRALKIAKKKGLPVTAGFHAQAENLSCHVRMQNLGFVNKAIYKNFYNHFYNEIDGIHYPTKFIRDTFEKAAKHTTNGYVISNGVNEHITKKDVQRPKEFENKIVILCTGRYSVEKAQKNLIKAVKFSKYKDKIQLIFAGTGPLFNKYKRMSKSLPIEPIFKLYGRDEMTNIINYCDLYVHTAEMELEGIACLEAICCGKMVIVSDSKKSATKNFVIDESCTYKSGSAKDLARVIDFWLDNPELKKEYENKYFEKSVEYNQTKCMKKMEEMIFEVDKLKKEQKI